jgi:excisionase family DNA binding protein
MRTVKGIVIESPLMDLPEASIYGHFELSTLRDWIFKRKIPFVKRGGRVFIRRKDLDALIDSCVVPAKADVEIREQAR